MNGEQKPYDHFFQGEPLSFGEVRVAAGDTKDFMVRPERTFRVRSLRWHASNYPGLVLKDFRVGGTWVALTPDTGLGIPLEGNGAWMFPAPPVIQVSQDVAVRVQNHHGASLGVLLTLWGERER